MPIIEISVCRPNGILLSHFTFQNTTAHSIDLWELLSPFLTSVLMFFETIDKSIPQRIEFDSQNYLFQHYNNLLFIAKCDKYPEYDELQQFARKYSFVFEKEIKIDNGCVSPFNISLDEFNQLYSKKFSYCCNNIRLLDAQY